MTKCPHCKKEIDSLDFHFIRDWKEIFTAYTEFDEHVGDDNWVDEERSEFYCPECKALLFKGEGNTEDEARKFLKGEQVKE